jgi:hypothetical protein
LNLIYQLQSRRLADMGSFPPGAARPAFRTSGRRLRGHHNLGSISVGQGIGMSAPIAGAVTSGLVAGTSIGAFAGPVGAAVGAIVGLIGSLFSAHSARAAGAKSENDAVNAFLPAFDQGLQTIFQQANNGTLSAVGAASACQSLLQQWFQNMAPYMRGSGRADSSNGGNNCGNGTPNPAGPCMGTEGGHKCDSSCTAGCCVGCQDLYPTILQAVQVFQNPNGGTIQACNVAGSSYGATARASYSLTYTPPAAGSVAGVANSLTAGGSSSLFLLLLVGVGAFLLLPK